MTRTPIWPNDAYLRELAPRSPAPMPAAAVVLAGGFLHLALPVCRVGERKRWETRVLVPYESRHLLWTGLRESGERDPNTFPLLAACDGARPWLNAESLWCRAAALLAACRGVRSPSNGVVLLLACLREALAVTGEVAEATTDAVRSGS